MHVWVSRSEGGGGDGGWNVGSVAGVCVSWYWCNLKFASGGGGGYFNLTKYGLIISTVQTKTIMEPY